MSHPPRRYLLPVPSLTTRPGPPGGVVRPRAKKASIACAECRRRRSKCTGGIPCDRCRGDKTACVVNEDSDRRRKGVLERRLELLERDRSLLSVLIESLQQANELEASRVLDVIRSRSSLDDIREFLDTAPRSSENTPTRQIYGRPLYQVPARPWTSLTDDSNYVSHLVSLYFTWNWPVQKWINRDLFIADMQRGDLNCRFCSPFLVNALLAVACCYSDPPEGDQPGRQSFFNEAKRLLEAERGKLSLTSFQGRCELYVNTFATGKHMLGWQYLIEISACARELMARRNNAKPDPKSQELARVLETAVTGSFSAPSVAFPQIHQPSMMPKPSYNRLPQCHDASDLWYPYPLESGPLPAHANCIANELFDLQLILWEISNNPFGDSIEQLCSTSRELADGFYRRLKHWALSLPQCITHRTLLSTPTPGLLDMHLRYNSAIISIYDGINTSQTQPNQIVQSQTDPLAICLASARAICSLLQMFVSRWSALYMPFTYVQYANLALSTLLCDLDNSESRRLYIESFTTLHTLAARLPVAAEVLQLVREQARQNQIQLPEEISCLARYSNAEERRRSS
ncbi:hypothetical protein BDV18DRAFT_62412 [Aspergillus unguis]